MEFVYVVPGIGESTLVDTTPLQTVIWIGIPTVLLGYFGAIRLAANGTDPGPPDGIPLNVGTLFPVYAAEPALYLLRQLREDERVVTPFPWDWRKSILTAGDLLAASIREAVPAGQQCSIIAHSAGGLVARRAWSALLGTADQGRIRRIVTLGTPHWGSYYAVLSFMGVGTLIDALLSINNTMANQMSGFDQVVGYKRWTREQIRDLLLTFPSLYELLPVVGAPDSSTDPNRIDLFNAANWGGGVFPQQAWLVHAFGLYRDWALSPSSLPPDDVMTSVAGVARSTPAVLIDPTRLGEPGGVGSTMAGDGTVTIASALLTNSQQIDVQSEHSSLFPDAVQNGNARLWILQSRSPTPVPPPPIVMPQPQVPQIQPFPGIFYGTGVNLVNSYRQPMAGSC